MRRRHLPGVRSAPQVPVPGDAEVDAVGVQPLVLGRLDDPLPTQPDRAAARSRDRAGRRSSARTGRRAPRADRGRTRCPGSPPPRWTPSPPSTPGSGAELVVHRVVECSREGDEARGRGRAASRGRGTIRCSRGRASAASPGDPFAGDRVGQQRRGGLRREVPERLGVVADEELRSSTPAGRSTGESVDAVGQWCEPCPCGERDTVDADRARPLGGGAHPMAAVGDPGSTYASTAGPWAADVSAQPVSAVAVTTRATTTTERADGRSTGQR